MCCSVENLLCRSFGGIIRLFVVFCFSFFFCFLFFHGVVSFSPNEEFVISLCCRFFTPKCNPINSVPPRNRSQSPTCEYIRVTRNEGKIVERPHCRNYIKHPIFINHNIIVYIKYTKSIYNSHMGVSYVSWYICFNWHCLHFTFIILNSYILL